MRRGPAGVNRSVGRREVEQRPGALDLLGDVAEFALRVSAAGYRASRATTGRW
jgi:hypothetical protein